MAAGRTTNSINSKLHRLLFAVILTIAVSGTFAQTSPEKLIGTTWGASVESYADEADVIMVFKDKEVVEILVDGNLARTKCTGTYKQSSEKFSAKFRFCTQLPIYERDAEKQVEENLSLSGNYYRAKSGDIVMHISEAKGSSQDEWAIGYVLKGEMLFLVK
jgi:hypothetical protein